MVNGVFSSTPHAVRRPVTYPPAAMTEREATALMLMLVQKRVEAARALGDLTGATSLVRGCFFVYLFSHTPRY